MVLAGIAVILGFLLPASGGHGGRRPHLRCLSNLKQIGTGFRMYANDNDAQLPNFNQTNEAWHYFQAAGDLLGSPNVLICPLDSAQKNKRMPIDFALEGATNSLSHSSHRNGSVSYFYGVNAESSNTNFLLAGDSSLAVDSKITHGLLVLRKGSSASWTKERHDSKGNILFADGSARFMLSADRLQQALRDSTNEIQRLIFP